MNKSEFRKLYKSVRKSLGRREKYDFDKRIFTSLVNSSLFQKSKSVLVYVSVNDEVDTADIIRFALEEKKNVAVPYCSGNKMDFLEIHSEDDLSEGKFGIPTADPDKCKVFNDFRDALCIVPGLSFDNFGNRLGYGGGFYDRFLENNKITTVGLTYERCISKIIPTEKYDIGIDYILTEKCLRNSKEEVST